MKSLLCSALLCSAIVVIFPNSVQAQPVNPTASVDTVAAGPNAGTIAVTSSWANCTGIDSVVIIVHSETAGGVPNQLITKTLPSPPALNATGSWPTTVTGMTTGHVVTKVEVRVYPQPAPGGGGQLLVAIAAGEKDNIRVTVP